MSSATGPTFSTKIFSISNQDMNCLLQCQLLTVICGLLQCQLLIVVCGFFTLLAFNTHMWFVAVSVVDSHMWFVAGSAVDSQLLLRWSRLRCSLVLSSFSSTTTFRTPMAGRSGGRPQGKSARFIKENQNKVPLKTVQLNNE